MKFKHQSSSRFSVLLVFLSLWFAVPSALAHTQWRYAYLGLAGNGTGMGTFGHAFLILTTTRGNFFDSKVYQYNIHVPSDFKLSVESALTVQNFPFQLFTTDGMRFILHYTLENRAVYLYELALDERTVQTLVRNLEYDRAAREKSNSRDYNLATNNCVTKTYEQINAVTSPNLGLALTPYRPSPLSFFRVSRESVSLAVPLATPLILKKHPLIKSTHYFRPIQVSQFERLLEQKRTLVDLADVCVTDAKTMSALNLLSSNVKTASSHSYILTLRDVFFQCAQSHESAKSNLIHLLDVIRYSAPNDQVRAGADRLLDLLLQ